VTVQFLEVSRDDAEIPADLDTEALNRAGEEALAKGRPVLARRYFEAAAGDRAAVGARANMVKCALALGDIDGAWMFARTLLADHPRHPLACRTLGTVALRGGNAEDKLLAGERLVDACPDDIQMLSLAAELFAVAGELEEAIRLLERAVAISSSDIALVQQLVTVRRRVCHWDELGELEKMLEQGVLANNASVDPFELLHQDSSAHLQLSSARQRAAKLPRHGSSARQPSTGLRPVVGFVSMGFGAHATTILSRRVLEQLQLQWWDVHLLATRIYDNSAYAPGTEHGFAGVHDVSGLAPMPFAELVTKLQVDVLIDLDGWCPGGRPDLFAVRAAPVQLVWLGYPGTTGADWFDGVVADRFVLPPEGAGTFSEPVLYLPRCYQCSDSTRLVGRPPSRAACGLPETNAMVFACFNTPAKLNARSFDRMLEVLKKVPDGVLWLIEPPGDGAERLRQRARAAEVDSDRLIFQPTLPHLTYLARYRHVDLVLDTEYYNGHTVSSDALWAGCPVLTRPGATFASRVAGSLNHHLGLSALNATDDEDFIARAVRFATDAPWRQGLRRRLQAQRSGGPAFSTRAYAQDFANLISQAIATKVASP